MIYGFDCEEEDAALAALLVYAVYRSRDTKRYRITPDLWGQAERFVKAAAKRARGLPEFLEALKPRFACETINPRAMQIPGSWTVRMLPPADEIAVGQEGETREFLTSVLARADDRAVLDRLYRETAYVVLLVRDRLERERPIEKRIQSQLEVL